MSDMPRRNAGNGGKRKRRSRLIARLGLKGRKIYALRVNPGRGAGLEPAHGKAQSVQAIGKAVRRGVAHAAGGYALLAAVDHALEEGAGGEHYRRGESIFNAGQPADRVYFIKTGQVSIVATQFANKKVIATLGPGDCFGEMAFFSNDIRTASVVSGEDADLLSLGKKDFLAVVKTRRRKPIWSRSHT